MDAKGAILKLSLIATVVATIYVISIYIIPITRERSILQGVCNVTTIIWKFENAKCPKNGAAKLEQYFYSPNIQGYFIEARNTSELVFISEPEKREALHYPALFFKLTHKQHDNGVLFYNRKMIQSNLSIEVRCDRTLPTSLLDSKKTLQNYFPEFTNYDITNFTEHNTWYFNCFYYKKPHYIQAILYHNWANKMYNFLLVGCIFLFIVIVELIRLYGHDDCLKDRCKELHKLLFFLYCLASCPIFLIYSIVCSFFGVPDSRTMSAEQFFKSGGIFMPFVCMYNKIKKCFVDDSEESEPHNFPDTPPIRTTPVEQLPPPNYTDTVSAPPPTFDLTVHLPDQNISYIPGHANPPPSYESVMRNK